MPGYKLGGIIPGNKPGSHWFDSGWRDISFFTYMDVGNSSFIFYCHPWPCIGHSLSLLLVYVSIHTVHRSNLHNTRVESPFSQWFASSSIPCFSNSRTQTNSRYSAVVNLNYTIILRWFGHKTSSSLLRVLIFTTAVKRYRCSRANIQVISVSDYGETITRLISLN